MLHGKTEVMQVRSLLRWTKPLCEGCWLHMSADCGSDQGHSVGQRGSWRQGMCPGLWRLLGRVANCKSSLASALGTHNCDAQRVVWAHLERWFEYPRSCLGQGLLWVWPGHPSGTSESHWLLLQSSPSLSPSKVCRSCILVLRFRQRLWSLA